jgi:hypothetical protein
MHRARESGKEPLMCFPRVLLAFSGLFLASLAWAQEVSSGPDQGKKVPPLKVFAATGPNKDTEIDYAAERKEKPTIYLFIQADKWDRPMARFLRKLDQALQKANDEAVLVAVWLTEDPAARRSGGVAVAKDDPGLLYRGQSGTGRLESERRCLSHCRGGDERESQLNVWLSVHQ